MTSTEIEELFRRPLTKVLTRAVLYGLTAWLGLAAADATEPAETIAGGVIAALFLASAALIDRWHHRKDTQEQ